MSAAALRLAHLVVKDIARAEREAARIIAAETARTARKSALPGKPEVERARERKAAGKREKREQTAEIRRQVEARAAGKCELCDAADDPRNPLEMHHLIMGRGRRRQEQAVSNCIMVCGMCHAVGHRRILYAGPGLLKWAQLHGYAEAERETRRRMDKALLADPTWPRDEDETRRLGPDAIRILEAQHPGAASSAPEGEGR